MFKTIYKTNKLSIFCITKNSTVEQKYNVIYKTDRNLITRLDEYGTKVDMPIYQHLSNFRAFNDHIMLFTLPDAATNTTIVTKELYLHNAVINNVKNLDKTDKFVNNNFLKHIILRHWHLKRISA